MPKVILFIQEGKSFSTCMSWASCLEETPVDASNTLGTTKNELEIHQSLSLLLVAIIGANSETTSSISIKLNILAMHEQFFTSNLQSKHRPLKLLKGTPLFGSWWTYDSPQLLMADPWELGLLIYRVKLANLARCFSSSCQLCPWKQFLPLDVFNCHLHWTKPIQEMVVIPAICSIA